MAYPGPLMDPYGRQFPVANGPGFWSGALEGAAQGLGGGLTEAFYHARQRREVEQQQALQMLLHQAQIEAQNARAAARITGEGERNKATIAGENLRKQASLFGPAGASLFNVAPRPTVSYLGPGFGPSGETSIPAETQPQAMERALGEARTAAERAAMEKRDFERTTKESVARIGAGSRVAAAQAGPRAHAEAAQQQAWAEKLYAEQAAGRSLDPRENPALVGMPAGVRPQPPLQAKSAYGVVPRIDQQALATEGRAIESENARLNTALATGKAYPEDAVVKSQLVELRRRKVAHAYKEARVKGYGDAAEKIKAAYMAEHGLDPNDPEHAVQAEDALLSPVGPLPSPRKR